MNEPKYLIKEHGYTEIDNTYIKNPEDLEGYLSEDFFELFENDFGQGFSKPKKSFKYYLNGESYQVDIEVKVDTQWMDRGDRLHMVGGLKSIIVFKIPTPEPLDRYNLTITLPMITEHQHELFQAFCDSQNIQPEIHA